MEVCGDGIDNDCDTVTDDCRLCNGEFVPDDDPRHCGTCGNACRNDQTCEGGSCHCPAGSVDCGVCADTKTSPDHCGTCGNACGNARTCRDGSCVCPDAAHADFCDGAGCVDLSTDASNCGTCGVACDFARSCTQGSCTCPAAAPDFCPGVGCVDFASNDRACGSCTTTCSGGQVCQDGACACPAGQAFCNGSCVDTSTSAANCGGCGTVCGSAQACVGGGCGCPSTTHSVCGLDCVDVTSNPAHCGACDRTCAPGEICSGSTCSCPSGLYCSGTCMAAGDAQNCGACGRTCGDTQSCQNGSCACVGFGLSACGTQCVYTAGDPANCGGCGIACRATEQCVNGGCACPSGQTFCEDVNRCVALSSDAAHCGSCTTLCRATETCQTGVCRCPNTGQSWCTSAGACVDTRSNPSHCGGCDIACRATEVCTNGTCACPQSTQRWCSGSCVDITSDPANCGGCGTACRTGEVCSGSACRCSGFYGLWCASAGTCVDTYNNSLHCGGCDVQCPAQTHCQARSCVCDQAGLTVCAGVCVDLKTDKNNCSTCGKTCPGAFTCVGGQCMCPDPALGAELRITNAAEDDMQPVAAWDGSHVGVVFMRATPESQFYEYRGAVYFALLNEDASVAFGPVQLSTPSTTSDILRAGPDLAWNGSEYAVAWSEIRYTTSAWVYETRFLRLTPAGGVKAATIVLATGQYDTTAPQVEWSSMYGGYGFSSRSTSLRFQRIGATGTTPDAPNYISGAYGGKLVAVPSGGWGISDGTLVQINADGSRTKPITRIPTTTLNNRGFDLAHDGGTWLVSWVSQPTSSLNEVWVNRGEQPNTPYKVATLTATNNAIWSTALAVGPAQTVAVSWDQSPTGASYRDIRLRRYTLPADSSSTLTPITNPILVLPSETHTDKYTVVRTARGAVAIWADNRWGADELYARALDYQSCP